MTPLIALAPILILFVLMLGFRVPAWLSSLTALIIAIAMVTFVAGPTGMLPEKYIDVNTSEIALCGLLEGFAKGFFPILLIIIMAIYSYNVVVASKSIEVIKEMFAGITSDSGVLVLMMTMGFTGILEAMAGFGTSVAIPAAILIGLGYKPVYSALVSLLGNTITGAFGALGVPVTLLSNEVSPGGLASSALVSEISLFAAIQLLPLFILTPYAILMLTDRKAWLKNLILSIWCGGATWITEYFCAGHLSIETPAILGSIVSILSLLVWERMAGSKRVSGRVPDTKKVLRAWSVYIFILFFILITGPLIPPLHHFLKTCAVTRLHIPILGSHIEYRWLSSAPLWLFAGSLAGGLTQGLSLRKLITILIGTLYQLRFTLLTILLLVAMASVMSAGGMITALALGLAGLTGEAYPLFAPLIGAIGTVVTGSHTSSNILFGKLQAGVAAHLGPDTVTRIFGVKGTLSHWIAASNITGATGGKIISPQTIAVATAACDMKGEDRKILIKGLPFALGYIAIGGLIVWLGTIL